MIALVTLVALFACVALGAWLRLNVGLLAIACAFGLGVGLAGMSPAEIAAGFPSHTFLTLVAVTLLFAQASVNGTLDALVARALGLVGGAAWRVGPTFFLLAAVASGIGLGNIAATALLAPVAMASAARVGVPPLLMAVLVASGANAGALSPLAPTGVIAGQLLAAQGLDDARWLSLRDNVLAQTVVAALGFLLLGGRALLASARVHAPVVAEVAPLDRRQRLTIAVLGLLLVSIVLFDADVTLGAFVGVAVLGVSGTADETRALKRVPWGALLLVCGVMVLIGVLDQSGALGVLTTHIAEVADAETLPSIVGLFAAVLSVFSSSSGVVLPTLLPLASDLAARVGGEALAVVAAVNVGSHLVDVSPLSTLGALCITAAPEGVDREALFRGMLVWGLSMAVVIVPVAWLLF